MEERLFRDIFSRIGWKYSEKSLLHSDDGRYFNPWLSNHFSNFVINTYYMLPFFMKWKQDGEFYQFVDFAPVLKVFMHTIQKMMYGSVSCLELYKMKYCRLWFHIGTTITQHIYSQRRQHNFCYYVRFSDGRRRHHC